MVFCLGCKFRCFVFYCHREADRLCRFFEFIFFLVGCYKGEFLATQLTSWIRPCVSNVSCDPKGFQLEWF